MGKKKKSKNSKYVEEMDEVESTSSKGIIYANEANDSVDYPNDDVNDESNYSNDNYEDNDHSEQEFQDGEDSPELIEIYKEKKHDSSHKKSSRKDFKKKSPARDPKIRPSKVDPNTTRHLWVSNLPNGTKTYELGSVFSEYGKVLAVKIIRGGNNSLLGFVKLETIEQAKKCMEKLNRIEFKGNKIEISKERPRDKDSEKIGFRNESRRYSPIPRPHPSSSRRGRPFRSPPGYRGSSRFSPRPRASFIERKRLEHEKRLDIMEYQRQKMENEIRKLKRERELLKSRDRFHEDKRSSLKPYKREGSFEEKRYADYIRREDFGPRRYDSRISPDRKMNRSFSSIGRGGARGFHDDSFQARPERFSDTKGSWPITDWSAMTALGAERWSTAYGATARMLSSAPIGASTLPRLHSGPELTHPSISSTRNYFNNRRY